MQIVKYIKNNHVHIKVKDYFNNPKHNEKEYDDGLYHMLPKGSVIDIYADSHNCSNWMEWAYNNPYQPTAERNRERDIYMPFLDGSHANATKNLGSLKTIWSNFVKDTKLYLINLDDIDINVIEKDFWNYYISKYKNNFERSVQVLQAYVSSRRKMMTQKQRDYERAYAPFFANDKVWMEGCRDFLKHLVYTSPRGYMMEIVLLAALKEYLNAAVEDSNAQDERDGIDGYVIVNGNRIPISLKPSTYNRNAMSPLSDMCWVIYHKKKYTYPDLVFEFKNGDHLLFGGK
jgi:hypothetical protein